ncbi:MAG: hypothetical protein AB7I27_06900 [Bacteriovoracaceae bacterium]
MKNVFLISLLFIFSGTAFANQYCYDRALSVVEEFKGKILECDSSIDLRPLSLLQGTLQSTMIGYSIRVRNQMSRVYKFINTDLPYGQQHPLPEEVKSCVLKLSYDEFDKVKVAVMDAIVICGP